jgi:hypothetical protein
VRVVLATALVLAGGCASTAGRGSMSPVSATAASAGSAGTGVTARPLAPRATPSPPRRQTSLRGTCDSLLPLWQVWQASGLTLAGLTRFVVGVPEPSIGRLAYLNCRYGIPPQHGATPAESLIEIGVSLYRTAALAQARILGTVYDCLYNNATESNRTVAGQRAVQRTGGVGPGYDVPLLVLADGQRTIAVSLATRAGTSATRWRAIVALAELVLTRTAR